VRIPMLYHQIMLSYQTFKVENKELLENANRPVP
jgi:hypothetical protein